MSETTLYTQAATYAMFLAGSALALTSAGTSYYILKHHPDHFKKTIFNGTVETYTTVKTRTSNILNGIYSTVSGYPTNGPKQSPFTITDVKIIQPDLILDMPTTAYADLSWSNYKPGTMIHVCYNYSDGEYRVVFGYGQDLSILTDNWHWIEEGFHNGIDTIDSNISEEDRETLWENIHQYAGPLGDFYEEAKHIQNSKGFLNPEMTARLITNSSSQYITVTNILGDSRRFPPTQVKLPEEKHNVGEAPIGIF
jgi:hypothetical protein